MCNHDLGHVLNSPYKLQYVAYGERERERYIERERERERERARGRVHRSMHFMFFFVCGTLYKEGALFICKG